MKPSFGAGKSSGLIAIGISSLIRPPSSCVYVSFYTRPGSSSPPACDLSLIFAKYTYEAQSRGGTDGHHRRPARSGLRGHLPRPAPAGLAVRPIPDPGPTRGGGRDERSLRSSLAVLGQLRRGAWWGRAMAASDRAANRRRLESARRPSQST